MARDEDKDVFDYGDRTIFQLRAQSFDVDDDYGTIIGPPVLKPVDVAAEPVSGDPLARVEQKLDTALRLLTSLQQKIDSIDATLARLLNR